MATATDPKDRARDAFSDLDTPQKTAFVIEATFSTIGAALRETGERLGDIIRDFDPDAFFHEPEEAAPAAAAPEAAPKPKAKRKPAPKKKAAAPKSATARKTAAKKASAKKPASTKTAGRSRKKTDDDKK